MSDSRIEVLERLVALCRRNGDTYGLTRYLGQLTALKEKGAKK